MYQSQNDISKYDTHSFFKNLISLDSIQKAYNNNIPSEDTEQNT
jgi:hypothetical protein